MLINYFKSSYPAQYLSLMALMVLLWLPSFIEPPEIASFTKPIPLWDLIVSLFDGSKFAALIFNFVIVFIGALLLNYVLNTYDIIPGNSLLGAFFYVLLNGVFVPVQQTGPLPLTNLLLLMLINVLLKLYDEKEGYRIVFSAGFIISVLFLLYPPLLFLIIPVYFIIILMGNVQWREFFIPITGFSLPLIYIMAYFFLVEKDIYFIWNLWNSILQVQFIDLHFDPAYWVLIIMSLFLLIIGLFRMLGSIPGKNIDQRKNLTSIIHFLFFLFVIYLLTGFEHRSQNIVLVPIVMVVTWYFSDIKKTTKPGIIVWLILGAGLFRNYILLFY